jgi:hypothetical protein
MVYKQIIYISAYRLESTLGLPGNTICEPRWSGRCTDRLWAGRQKNVGRSLEGRRDFSVRQSVQTSSEASLPSHSVRKVDTLMEGKHTQLGSDYSPRRSAEQ